MFKQRFPKGEQGQLHAAPWLKFIHAANGVEPGFFGNPVIKNDDRGYVEVYPHATVVFPADDAITVVITATTDHGNDVLKAVQS